MLLDVLVITLDDQLLWYSAKYYIIIIIWETIEFDDKDEYVQKFAEIFKEANIHSIAVVVMEVPCCSALPMIVKQGMEKAGKRIPLEEIVISARGDVLKREKQAAWNGISSKFQYSKKKVLFSWWCERRKLI